MDKSRRRLLFASAGAGAFATVLSACGGGGGYSPSSSMPPPSPPPPPGTLSCSATAIVGNHGHSLTIPAADTNSMVSMTYNIQGISDHNHMVTLTPAQLAQIKVMSSVTITSTFGSSANFPNHQHDVTVNCA
jgi:hypothetical protein